MCALLGHVSQRSQLFPFYNLAKVPNSSCANVCMCVCVSLKIKFNIYLSRSGEVNITVCVL